MRLTALRLRDVRRFADRGIAIEGIADGVNLFCAANEHGKSTCFDALHALFFVPHTSEAAAVQALRPYGGGNPLIEADIATGTGRFRLTKQFWGGRRATVLDLATGHVVARAGEAEAFVASLVRGGATGPAGLLWVRQGNTGLDRRRDEEKQARAGILSSVRGEVEALTGGRRMAEVARACEDDLGILTTPTGRPKAGGPYALAIAERDRWLATSRALARDMETLRAALERRREVRRRLADIARPEQEAARRDLLARAEAEHAAAASRLASLKAAEAEAALAAERRGAAERRATAYRDELDRARSFSRRLAEALAHRDAVAERRRETVAASEEAQAGADLAEREEAAARDVLARLERAMRAREDAERRSALEENLARAKELRAEIERLEAVLRALSLPQGDLQALERIEVEIAGLRAALGARSASLRIDYEPGVAAALSLDGTALADGEERALPASGAITIAGIGRLTVTLPRPADEIGLLRRAEADRAALLGRLGVDGLAAAHLRANAARERRAELEIARERLALLAPKGIPALQEESVRLAQAGEAEDVPEVDIGAARGRLASAEDTLRLSRQAIRTAQPRRDKAHDDLIQAETTLAALAADLNRTELALGPEQDRAARLDALEAETSRAQDAAAAARTRVETLRAATADLPRLEATLRRARSAADAAGKETAQLQLELADLSSHIRTRSEEAVEEAHAEADEARAAAEARLARIEREIAVLRRLREVLDAARVSARDHYFQPVMRELAPMLELLFEDASVTFDDATLLPGSVRRNGIEESVGSLSGGAVEQLAILTRLAFARLLAREGHPAPVILDDALVYSDDDRIERMFDVLHRQAGDQQIIVFSCRQRAFAQLGGNVLRMVPWTPAA